MSTNLYWRRVGPKPKKSLAIGLKWAIERRFGSGSIVLGESHVGWLEGVADASRDDGEMRESCQTLVDVIHEDGAVEVWIEE